MKTYIPELDCYLVSKADDWFMQIVWKVLAFFNVPFDNFWTTYRFPFCKARITHPTDIENPLECKSNLEHEGFHIKQFQPWYGPLVMALGYTLFPLPAYYSGRWYIERKPYLNDIRKGVDTLEKAVKDLWEDYGKPWPKDRMEAWFRKQLEESDQ